MKINSRLIFDLIFYGSLPFLAFILYKFEYLSFPKIYYLDLFLVSILVLLFSTFLLAFCWYKFLVLNKVDTNIKNCIASVGLPVFSKYIPGKIFMVIGPAAYIAKDTSQSLANLTLFTLQNLLLTMTFSLIIGLFYFVFISYNFWMVVFCILNALFFIFAMSNKKINYFGNKKLNDWLDQKYEIPLIKIRTIFHLSPYYLFHSLSLSFAFYFFARSILGDDLNWSIGLIFPLSITIGNYALFAPGGIGVREGTLAFLLNDYGLSPTESVTLSVASRAWTLLGELFLFMTGVYFKK